jgi:hypothetical protein
VTPPTPPPAQPHVTVSVSGIVRKVEIYGQPSVWSIVSEEGKTYTPLNGLDITLRSDGLRVSIQGVLRPDVASRVAGGQTIELNSIK